MPSTGETGRIGFQERTQARFCESQVISSPESDSAMSSESDAPDSAMSCSESDSENSSSCPSCRSMPKPHAHTKRATLLTCRGKQWGGGPATELVVKVWFSRVGPGLVDENKMTRKSQLRSLFEHCWQAEGNPPPPARCR